MIKPVMHFQMDQDMVLFLVGEMARMEADAADQRFSDNFVTDYLHFATQLKAQMEAQGVSLDVEEEEIVAIVQVDDIPDGPIPSKTAFMYEGKAVGEITGYHRGNKTLTVTVLDKEARAEVLAGTHAALKLQSPGEGTE